MAVTGGEKDPGPAANTPKISPNPDRTVEPSSPKPSEHQEGTTPEQEAKHGSEERIRGLLKAYQQTLDTVEELPAVVWVPWDREGPGSYFKIPYLRWFLAYFVTYHIDKGLNTLNRRFQAIAALSGDPDANWSTREAVKLYLQSLPKPPYGILIFAAVLGALVIALPLQSFGNVFYVLDLVGAVMRFNVGYVGRALEGNELGPTVRSLIILLVGLIVVGALLTSPFGLKRILFNLHPWTKERLDRGQEPRFQGRRPLYPGRQCFRRDWHPAPPRRAVGSRVPNLLACVPACFRALPGGRDLYLLHVLERAPQREHWGSRRCPLFLAECVLGLLRSVYRARVRCVHSPPQTTRRSLEETKPERDRLKPPTASI